MYLTYIDEVKYDPPTQPYYWLCGLAIPESSLKSVEAALSGLAESYFGTSILDKKTEFHAQEIIQGKGPYSGHAIGARLDLFKRIADVIDQHADIGRIQIRLNPSRITRDDYERIAFMYMVERLDQLMLARASIALLIADHDREFANANVRSLSAFKAEGTEFEFGQDISCVVDTVHHTQSHHSRLLQLADHYAYAICLSSNKPDKAPRKDAAEYVNALSNFTGPTKYKYWPPGEP